MQYFNQNIQKFLKINYAALPNSNINIFVCLTQNIFANAKKFSEGDETNV